MLVSGKKPSTQVLQFKTATSSEISAEVSENLNLDPGEKLYYNDTKIPVWIANVIFRGDAFELHNRRGPILTEASQFDISINFKKGPR